MLKIPTIQALEDLPRALGNRKRVSAWLQSCSNVRSNAHDKTKEHPYVTMVTEDEDESGRSGGSGNSQRGRTTSQGGSASENGPTASQGGPMVGE